MKIISWNVNSIRVAWDYSLSLFLNNSNAGIYCLHSQQAYSAEANYELENFYQYLVKYRL